LYVFLKVLFILDIDGHNFSCCINTDGVKLFKASKLSVWPLFLSINELDFKVRRDHTILVGLWFGSEKATLDTFLKPLVPQMNSLSLTPLEWQYQNHTYQSNIVFPMLAADSVARCALQGVKQYNGESSCTYCVATGKQFGVNNL